MPASSETPAPLGDARILDSWQRNAAPWTEAVRERRIDSRRLVTDQAIIDAVLARRPRSVLDLGCGEGWLARALNEHGIAVTGTDAVLALVEQAREAGGGDFHALSYEDIAAGALALRVDAAVCNFSLIGGATVERLLREVPRLLLPGGALLVQTLHPRVACGDAPYVDGWREGSWAGFGDAFSDPAPWYFRTLESWAHLLADSGLRLAEQLEPVHPATSKPASVIFVAELAA